jgi:hypothetical protein
MFKRTSYVFLFLEVNDGGGVPVLGSVDVTLGRCGHHQVPVAQAALNKGKVSQQMFGS